MSDTLDTLDSVQCSGSDLTQGTLIGGGRKMSISKGESFISYMSTITENDKVSLLNLAQYILLAIIPVTILLKLLAHFSPVQDPSKGSVELLVEVVVELTLVIFALYFIHKMILYIPTYSKKVYDNVNFLNIILPFVFLLFTLDTNIGDKVNVLLDRGMVMIGLKRENFETDEECDNKIDAPNALMLDPPVGGGMLPMNTTPERVGSVAHPSVSPPVNNLGTGSVPPNGGMILQDQIMAANTFGGGFSNF